MKRFKRLCPWTNWDCTPEDQYAKFILNQLKRLVVITKDYIDDLCYILCSDALTYSQARTQTNRFIYHNSWVRGIIKFYHGSLHRKLLRKLGLVEKFCLLKYQLFMFRLWNCRSNYRMIKCFDKMHVNNERAFKTYLLGLGWSSH